jgi:hypothetical protein
VRSDQLTTDQVETLYSRIAPMLEYVGRLEQRMHVLKFAADDPLFRLVIEARNCTQGICTELSYLTCDSLLGKPTLPKKRKIPGGDDPLGRKPRK